MQKTLLETLDELVSINSPVDYPKGVLLAQNFVQKQLTTLGFQCDFIKNPLGDEISAPLLKAELLGLTDRFITFIFHTDTIFPNSDYPFSLSPDKTMAFGSGIADDKAGVIIALEGIRLFLEQKRKLPFSLRVISSPNEEKGSLGFTSFFEKMAHDTFLVLGFEPALSGGHIISSRRGNKWYDIELSGKEAHAGRQHSQGINAALELAHKIVHLNALTDYEEDITVSVGHIQGGIPRYNVVCAQASAKIDTRFADIQSQQFLHEEILKIFNKDFSLQKGGKCHVSYKVTDDCPAFGENSQGRIYLESYLKILNEIEKDKKHAKKSGGAGDCNYFSQHNNVIIDGLGAIGEEIHTKKEFIFCSSLLSRAHALARFLMELS